MVETRRDHLIYALIGTAPAMMPSSQKKIEVLPADHTRRRRPVGHARQAARREVLAPRRVERVADRGGERRGRRLRRLAAGVGQATNRAVVQASVAVLVLDYVLTAVILGQGVGV